VLLSSASNSITGIFHYSLALVMCCLRCYMLQLTNSGTDIYEEVTVRMGGCCNSISI
jgi:hypothetical protein